VPATIFTLFAIYIPSFCTSLFAYISPAAWEDGGDEVPKESAATPLNGHPDPEQAAEDASAETSRLRGEGAVRPDAKLLRTILLGAPSPTSLLLSMVTFLINLCMVLMSADFLLSARLYFPSNDVSFVRLGFVSPTEAKFIIREPNQAKMPLSLEIHVKDAQPPFDNPLWQLGGGVRWTDESTDYTAALTVPLLHSHQRIYEWRTSNNQSGEFVAPPKPGKASTYHDGKFTFLATSCIIPRFPYSPSDHALAIPGLRYLAELLPSLGAQFMLFMGDFIYIDVPYRFGETKEDYRQKYRHVYASPDWKPVSQNLSWVHVLDDHEISNDWSANTTGVYEAALDPWNSYHAEANPQPPLKAGTSTRRVGATYYEFTQGPASFFMLDTRTYRSPNDMASEDAQKSMLGKEQLDDLLYWLNRPEPKGVRWKVVASSVPFTKNWPVNNKDTWGGFLGERKTVLEAMWDAGARGMGVVIVSGDRHEFAATKFPPPVGSKWADTTMPYEFSASPLNQFSFPLPSYKQVDSSDVMIRYVSRSPYTWQWVDSDSRLIRYINRGSSKFGALTFDTDPETGESRLSYRLFIDGLEAWSMTVVAPAPANASEETKKSFWFWDRFMKS
jgi:alkaline phosphatase D